MEFFQKVEHFCGNNQVYDVQLELFIIIGKIFTMLGMKYAIWRVGLVFEII